ncbi:MAG: hypothetical protein ACI4LX_06260 [Treponema sp.]
MKTTLKTIFILTVSLLFSACNALFDNLSDSQGESQKAIEPGYAEVVITVAEPAARSVIIPDFTKFKESIDSYEITVSAGDETYTTTVSAESDSILIKIKENTENTVSVVALDSSAVSIASGNASFTPTQSNKTVEVILSATTSSSANGSIDITVDFPDDTYNAMVYVKTSATPQTQIVQEAFIGSSTINITKSDVSCGAYTLELNVTHPDTGAVLVFIYDLIVYPGQTSTKVLTSSGIEYDIISLTQ